MNIKTKLKLLFIILILSIISVISIFQFSFNRIEDSKLEHDRLLDIKNEIHSLGLTLYEYSIGHNTNVRFKWNVIHGSVMENIKLLSFNSEHARSLHASYLEIDVILRQVIEIEEREKKSVDTASLEEKKEIDDLENKLLNEVLEKLNGLLSEVTLLVDVYHEELGKNFEADKKLILYFIIFVNLIVLSLVYLIYRSIFKPLARLMEGIDKIISGDFTHEVRVISDDEIGKITTAFNVMTKQMYKTNLNVEKQVHERTQELERINDYMVGREMKMIELKKELNNLSTQRRNLKKK
jgi:methyl-accepting chemotaxis protein